MAELLSLQCQQEAPSNDHADVHQDLARIAWEELGFETLETRRSDALDFGDCGVWCVREALLRAYELGRDAKS